MRKTLWSLVVALMLAWSGAAIADYHLSKGLKAYFAGDYGTAARLFRELAEQGDVEAQAWLGSTYSKLAYHNHVMADYVIAAKWWQLSAEQGNTRAQSGLGFLYSEGKGVIQDFVTAHMWYNIVAVSGNITAVVNREYLETKMTQTQIAEAQKMAREWVEKHQAQ